MPTTGIIAITPGAGQFLDALQLTVNAQTVFREVTVLGDPTAPGNLAGVTAGGLLTVTDAAAESSLATIAAAPPPSAASIGTAVSGDLLIGTQLAAASVPVALPAATIATLTPPAAITGFALESTLGDVEADLDTIAACITANVLAVSLPSATVTTLTPPTASAIGTAVAAALTNPLPVSGTVTTSPPSNASTNLTQVAGSNLAAAPTTKANSVPVSFASDEAALGVTGSVTATGTLTANIGTTGGLALDTTVANQYTLVDDPNNSYDSSNGATPPLGAGASFTGAATFVHPYSTVHIGVISDVASAANGISVQFASEFNSHTHWDFVAATTYPGGGVGVTIPSGVRGSYFRIVYTNGATPQTYMRIETHLEPGVVQLTKRFLSQPPVDSLLALLTNSVLSGKSVFGNKYVNVLTDNAGNLQIGFGTGGSSTDAFGRARVGNPTTLFTYNFEFNAQPLLFDIANTGAATTTKTTNISSVTLNTGGTTSGDGTVMQSHRYWRYEAGKSQLTVFTGVLGAQKTNVRSRYGYFDANNGCYFEMDGTNGASVTVRTNTSGSPSNAVNITQANWNLDTMNGSGPTGVNIDWSKEQIFIIDMQWLGTGRVRFGFVANGVPVYCHQVLNDNRFAVPYMNTARLPIRAEIFNTGTAASGTTMTMVCGSVISEGGEEAPSALQFTANNGANAVTTITTRRPILSIQPQATFNSIPNRVSARPQNVLLYCDAPVFYEIVYGCSLTGASFASVDSSSGTYADTAATALSGGTVIASGYVAVGGSGQMVFEIPITSELMPTVGLAGTGDILSVVLTRQTGGTTHASASIVWQERRN